MSIKINYSNKSTSKSSVNLVLFVNQNFNISGLKKIISDNEFSYISDLLKTSDLKKDLLFFEINSKKTIYLVSIKKDLKKSDIESLGAKFHSYINYDKKNDYLINSDTLNSKFQNFQSRVDRSCVFFNPYGRGSQNLKASELKYFDKYV